MAPNPGGARDLFVTPDRVVDGILSHLPLDGPIVEPAAGDGAILRRVIAAGVQPEQIEAFEIVAERAARVRRLGVRCLTADALRTRPSATPKLVIMNPPFRLGLEFVRAAIGWTDGRGTVAALMRLGMLGAEKRADFWKDNAADVYVIVPRPSFTRDGGNYQGEFAWFVFGPGRGGRWSRLEAPRPEAPRRSNRMNVTRKKERTQ